MEEFFNEKVLNKLEDGQNEHLKNLESITYNCDKVEGGYSFYITIDDERLTSNDMKIILKLNTEKKGLNDADVAILNYIVHRLSTTQTYYRIHRDFDIIFSHIRNSKKLFYFSKEKVKFSSEKYKLNISIYFDENNQIKIKIHDEGEFIFGMNQLFFIKNNIIYNIDTQIPLDFYKEIIEQRHLFSIDTFFTLKKTYLDKLKNIHNLTIDDEVQNLSNLNLEEKVAPLVLNIDKTAHFIAIELMYKIGDETFKITDYTYADTINWIDKQNLIKIVKEDNKLVKYISDEDLSEDILDEIFDGSRIRYRQYMKSAFRITLPIFHLDNLVSNVLPKAEKIVEVNYSRGQKINLVNGKVEFDIETQLYRDSGLLEFSVKFKIGSDYFTLDFIKNLMLQSRKYVQLKNGTTINVENIREINKWIEFLKKFNFARNNEIYKGTTESALELDKFLEGFEDKTIKSNREYQELILELKDKKPIEPIELPEEVRDILRQYQKEGVYWLYFLKKYGFGGVLADEMGLGKTLQALTILAMEKGGTSIVICPKTLIYNWENEVKKYFPKLRALVIDGDNEKRKRLISECKYYNIVITSYSMLQKDYKIYTENKLVFNYSVLDEAHYVKNIKTLSAKAVRLIKSKNRFLLTGTPLENNLSELYGTFDLIMPEFLGSKPDFTKEFVSKIERNNMIALEILQAKIRPFILRRTKKEVLKELPDKQEQIVFSEMTNKQIAIYNEILRRVRGEVNQLVKEKGFDRSRIQILSALLKLRQICNHPSLLDTSFKNEDEISGKYDQFLELLSEVIDNGEKVLVFSQFTSMLDIFEEDLQKSKIKYSRLDGSTKNRQELVDEFNNNDKIKVFLISLKAGGVGLNLTSASTVFLYDPWWNPMVEQQAQDRAHRIGQKNTVNVYKFITKNSIEEKILKLQERKGNMFENLVVEDQGFVKRLEWEDLMDLFEE